MATKTIGDYYNEIENARKTMHDIQIIMGDFPKGCYVYETMKTANEFIKKYKQIIQEIEVSE